MARSSLEVLRIQAENVDADELHLAI